MWPEIGGRLIGPHAPVFAIAEIGLNHGGDLDHKGRVDVSGDMTSHDEERLYQLISNHVHYTGSTRAKEILDDWASYRPKFRKVMPVEYRRALQEMERARMGMAAE